MKSDQQGVNSAVTISKEQALEMAGNLPFDDYEGIKHFIDQQAARIAELEAASGAQQPAVPPSVRDEFPLLYDTLDALDERAAEQPERLATKRHLSILRNSIQGVVQKLSLARAQQPASREVSTEVCPVCDIAGCKHIRERQANAALAQGELIEFCEDTAITLAERTFSTEVGEQLAEDVIRYARLLHEHYAAYAAQRIRALRAQSADGEAK